MACLHGSRNDARATDQKRHPHIELEGEALAFDQSELAQVIAVVRCVYDVRVIQLTKIPQFLFK